MIHNLPLKTFYFMTVSQQACLTSSWMDVLRSNTVGQYSQLFGLLKQNLNKVTYIFLSYSSFRAADLSARLLLQIHQLKSYSLVPFGKSYVAQTIYLLHICKLLWNLFQTITPPFEYCALLDSKSSKIFST